MSSELSGSGNGRSDRLTHVDEHGKAHMVDVTGKPSTIRTAEARCLVRTSVEVVRAVTHRAETDPATGLDLLETARVAGIMAAKQTASLVPLCHPLRIDDVDVDVATVPEGVCIRAAVGIVDRTGVEIEALTACTVAALVVIQPVMALDAGASIDDLTVWHKSGGRSGTWRRTAAGEVERVGDGAVDD
jgi:cyclic pyranopterin phosphate synthase